MRSKIGFSMVAAFHIAILTGAFARASDWPMWRGNAGRTGVSSESLPKDMQLTWKLDLPALEPAYRDSRLQFDAGYEPVAAGDLLFVASSRNDSVTAYDAATGSKRWRFYAAGPVRFAPCAWRDCIFFGSDDGYLYCLKQTTGKLVWRFQAAPNNRTLLGNQRLISVWPVRGGPVVADDRVYFAAGVFSFEGIFIYALDAATGEVDWLNDRTGVIYGIHPHGAEAFGGLTPQGYLVAGGEELIIPCGSAYPARLHRETGELIEFKLPKQGRYPGGWFAALDQETARDLRRGKVLFDEAINQKLHEDKIYQGAGTADVQSTIQIGEQQLKFADRWPGVEEDIHSILAANGRLFVVAKSGSIYCFSTKQKTAEPSQSARPARFSFERFAHLRDIVPSHGYAIVTGIANGDTICSLAANTSLSVIGMAKDASKINSLRQEMDGYGWYGTRVSLLAGDAVVGDLPPYLASLIICQVQEGDHLDQVREIVQLYQHLRPYDGVLCVDMSDEEHARLSQSPAIKQFGAEITRRQHTTVIRRVDPLSGSQNYTGGWLANRDTLVRAPFGVLWFDDALGHFKRSPQPQFIDGVMISRPKNWHYPKKTEGPHNVDYPLLGPALSDMYTGRILAEETSLLESLEKTDPHQREPSQYRPPRQKDAWKPEQPKLGKRINPMSGKEEPRIFPKSYGCDGGVDYGNIYTMRSGTPAIYDKSIESGTINISGPRSGCTNSIIPACGLLNLPYFYEGCTCSYPLPVGFSMVSMPETHEQWAAWGESKPEGIHRVGINFGAPGDRVTRSGTLWLDYPNVGGPSPEIAVDTEPTDPSYYYQHSARIRGGQGWPWVSASGVEGLDSIEIGGIRAGRYTVRLYFAEPETSLIGDGNRVQTITLQGETIEADLNLAEKANGKMRSLVLEKHGVDIDKTLRVEFNVRAGRSIVSGIEIVKEGLTLGPIISLAEQAKTQLQINLGDATLP